MHDFDSDIARRTLLLGAAGLAFSPIIAQAATAAAATPDARIPGNGEFNFLAGEWKIANRQRQADGRWKAFPGAATVHTVLGGLGSVEQLRIPPDKFLGMGLRVFDVEKKLWADHWVAARFGVVNLPMMGSFKDGVGTFLAEDMIEGKSVVTGRGVWDRITPTSCRWFQSSTNDGGKTWDDSWLMDWTRV
jgi:hypothetical protein